MNFANVIGTTTDALELLQLIFCVVDIAMWVLLVRLAWADMQWSMEDHVSFIRWLGVTRFAKITLYGAAIFLMTVNICLQMTVPSAISDAETFLDTFAAVTQRVVSTAVLAVFGLSMLIDHVLRGRAEAARESAVTVPATAVDFSQTGSGGGDVVVLPTADQTEAVSVPPQHQPPAAEVRTSESQAAGMPRPRP